MNDKRILACLALGLLVGGLLGPFLIALLGSRELAVGFAVVTELLALIFGALSFSERIGKIVTVMGAVLAVTAVVTTILLIPIRERQEADRREESKKQMIRVHAAAGGDAAGGDAAGGD